MGRARDAAGCAWWSLRHAPSLAGLLGGASFRDLVLREDLRRIGIRLTAAESRGLGLSGLAVAVVERLRARLGDLAPRTLLDVGAAGGSFAVAAALAFPGCRAFSFEPLPEAHGRLAAVARRRPGIRAFPFALGDGDGALTLHRSGNPGSSSLLAMREEHRRAFPGTATDGEFAVEVRRLDGLVSSGLVALEGPVLMKIDVQGFEDRVLDGARETLRAVDALIVEMSLVPLYEGQILAGPLRSRIEALGLSWEGEFDRVVSPATGEVCQVDGLFRRRP